MCLVLSHFCKYANTWRKKEIKIGEKEGEKGLDF
jgi:hypothetical protein